MTTKIRTSKKVAGYLCVYCQIGRVRKLPAKCPNCKRSLKLKIQPSMGLKQLVERAFDNGLRLDFKAIPAEGKGGGIVFSPVRQSQERTK